MGRPLRRATWVVLGAATLAPAGCALLVGDPDGHRLFTGDPDAVAAEPDSMTADATKDGASAPSDAGVTPTEAGTELPDAKAEAGGPGVRCSHAYCSDPGSVCCFSNLFDPTGGGACTPETQCFSPSVSFFCSSRRDCFAPDDYCCAQVGIVENEAGQTSFGLIGAACAPSCTPVIGRAALLCDPQDPGSIQQCTAIDAGCQAASLAPWQAYYSCQ
jgi:hypothetical protein